MMHSPEFREVVRGRWARFGQGNPPDPLGVAILGPDLNADTVGSQKRIQIKETLTNEGHKAFCPEDIAPIDPQVPIIEQEPNLLDSVDLILVLFIEDNPDVEIQIKSFASIPALIAKTVVLLPEQLYDTLSGFPIVKPYSDEALETCSVVAESTRLTTSRKWHEWASTRFMRF